MKTLRKYAALFLLMLSLSIAMPAALSAQCAMCKLSAENAATSKKHKQGLSLNTGILILLSTPYAIIGVVGVMWYKKSRKGDE